MSAPENAPEILAPAGTEEAFAAALASGADAVYLGLSEGFNARARSTDFTLSNLPDLVRRAHLAGVRLYLTLNTLVFESELAELERVLRGAIRSGVDALIVQDPGTALLARRLSPEIRLHASTQMTISSPEGARFAATLGVNRVVLPRELSLAEIALFVRDCPLEAEVFVHGALCMAWSGQCLTSEAFSGRSANRGQCSQACRMPYEAVIDGERRELGDLRYLLSPEDLAAHDALPELVAIGVRSLKIEGRYKGPAYVSMAVDSWRNWRDAVLKGPTAEDRARKERDVERARLTFSRGGNLGFLRGDNHQTLVPGVTPKHRGVEVGQVRSVARHSVIVAPRDRRRIEEFLRPGVGVKFELLGRSAADHDPENAPGGPLFGVQSRADGSVELRFGRPGPDLRRVHVGDSVRLTADPEINKEVKLRTSQPAWGRIPLALAVWGRAGEKLRVRATLRDSEVEVSSDSKLDLARSGHGLDQALLVDKLGALGETPFWIDQVDTSQLDSGLFVPVSELKRLRRELVQALEEELLLVRYSETSTKPCLTELSRELSWQDAEPGPPQLIPLCRTEEQLDAVIGAGLGESALGEQVEVELDWMEMVGLGKAVRRAREAGLRVTLATVRVQKPGEEAYDRRIAGLAPDGVLVRHWGALVHFAHAKQESGAPEFDVHGDFSLNVTNSLTARHLLGQGLCTVTASHDLNKTQLVELLQNTPRGRVAVTLHHHIATFHNSHCVYARLLSTGTDYKTCGRPCDEHRIALRDYAGHDHPVVVDVSCRNTMFSAAAQSAARLVPQLLELGVRRFRVEFVWEKAHEVQRLLQAYQALLAGAVTPAGALEVAGVQAGYGLTDASRLVRR